MNHEKMTNEELIETLAFLESKNHTGQLGGEFRSLLQALQAHQLELEMQNRELREAQQELEESRNRYADLYDFAPIGYITLDGMGIIQEINMAGADLLDDQPSRLIGRSFFPYVLAKDSEIFRDHLRQCGRVKDKVTTELRLKVNGGPLIQAQFQCIAVKDDDTDTTLLRMAITDITKLKETEQALQRANEVLEQRVAERTAKLQQALEQVESLKNRLEAENIYLKEQVRKGQNFEAIVGESNAIKAVLEKVRQVAGTDAIVILLGETGTGKELIAHAIHSIGSRRNRPFVKVNCATLPASLIESELFGHERGAFTGAHARQLGRFELADKGTILLDEIGDLPLDLQGKLLRVLQTGEFERVGDSRTRKVNVRVIAATNIDLRKAMRSGKFRHDLYFRLDVFPIRIPPLRERKEDIPILTHHFVQKYATKYRKNNVPIPQNIMDTFLDYSWPGNVRELENITERAVIIERFAPIQGDASLDFRDVESGAPPSSLKLKDVEYEHILRVLNETQWLIEGKGGAAVRLGMNASTLRSRMQKLGIRRPS